MHGLSLAEVAPAAPLLIPAATFAAWWIVIGWCAMVSVFVALLVFVIGNTVGRLPLIGGAITSGANELGSGITNRLGRWSHSAHVHAGAAMHSMARIVDWMGHEIEQHSRLLVTLTGLFAGQAASIPLYNALNRLRHRQAQTEAWIQAEQRVNHAQTKVAGHATTTAHVAHRTAIALPRAVEHEWDIPALRERTAAIEHGLARLWHWVRARNGFIPLVGTVVPVALATALVATALPRLRLGWLRCESLGRLGRKIGCGGFGAIEDVLFGAVTALAITDICTFSAAAYRVAQKLEPVLLEIVDVQEALVGCHGATRPPALHLPARDFPPVPDPLPLAA